jgi:hypothetical protein
MDKNVWIVINNGNYQVFTEMDKAQECEGTIVIAPLDPPVVNTYKVTAVMHTSIEWKVEFYGKAGASKAHGWSRYGDEHGNTTYHWHVQATSPKEAIQQAKQLFRDSI